MLAQFINKAAWWTKRYFSRKIMKFITQTIKHKDAILKNQEQMSYKRYQNKVVDLNISKEVYYKNYFQKII